jgi:hypothetical protein
LLAARASGESNNLNLAWAWATKFFRIWQLWSIV